MSDLPRIPATPANWQWQSRAACRGLGDDLFFASNNERAASRRRRERAAKVVCATCPVIHPCLAWALSADEPYGVWGGLSADERSKLRAHSANRRASAAAKQS
jgi:WhiB family redox-sensing transcriptional regulator